MHGHKIVQKKDKLLINSTMLCFWVLANGCLGKL